MSRDIEQIVANFVLELEKAFAKQTADKVNQLFGSITNGKKAISARGVVFGVKRSQEDIEGAQEQILSCLKQYPGIRCEELAKKLGVDTGELSLPLRKLGKKLRTEGVARGRRYWAK